MKLIFTFMKPVWFSRSAAKCSWGNLKAYFYPTNNYFLTVEIKTAVHLFYKVAKESIKPKVPTLWITFSAKPSDDNFMNRLSTAFFRNEVLSMSKKNLPSVTNYWSSWKTQSHAGLLCPSKGSIWFCFPFL